MNKYEWFWPQYFIEMLQICLRKVNLETIGDKWKATVRIFWSPTRCIKTEAVYWKRKDLHFPHLMEKLLGYRKENYLAD